MNLPIIDGRLNFRGATLAEWRARILVDMAASVGFPVPELSDVAAAPALPARVDHGRWIVDCPDCKGAEFVWIDGPLVMMCVGCWNAMVGHKWRPVEMPAERAAIERILRSRPMPQNRNWFPSETIEDLATENLEHAADLRPVEV